MKNLYLISQEENNGWDTFDSAVVCAKSAAEAKQIVPGYGFDSWASPQFVTVEYLGKAKSKIKLGSVICASFNAG